MLLPLHGLTKYGQAGTRREHRFFYVKQRTWLNGERSGRCSGQLTGRIDVFPLTRLSAKATWLEKAL